MKELCLYVHEELSEQLKFQNSDFIRAFTELLNIKLMRYVTRELEKASDAEYFQIRSATSNFETWFVGCVGVTKVINTYYTGIVCGNLTGGKAADFQSMAKRAQEEYGKHFPAAYETVENLVYNTSSVDAGHHPHLSFQYADSSESA